MSKMNKTKKYPYEILLGGSRLKGGLREMNKDTEDNTSNYWEKLSPEESIKEMELMLYRYSKNSGWWQSIQIEKEDKEYIKEKNHIVVVLKTMKRRYKKYYGRGIK